MGQSEAIKLFEEKKVRTIWDDVQEKWYFSVLDVIQVLAESVNPTDYFKKMRKRDEQLASFVGTNCPQVLMSGDRSDTSLHNEKIAKILHNSKLFTTFAV